MQGYIVSSGPGTFTKPFVNLAAIIYGNVLSDEKGQFTAAQKEDAKKLLNIFWENETTRSRLVSEMQKERPFQAGRSYIDDPKTVKKIKEYIAERS